MPYSSPLLINKSIQTEPMDQQIHKTTSLLSFEDIEKQICNESYNSKPKAEQALVVYDKVDTQRIVTKTNHYNQPCRPFKTARKVKIPSGITHCPRHRGFTTTNNYIRSHYANRLAKKVEREQRQQRLSSVSLTTTAEY
ncbi:hypothetical protein ACOME3_008543 [Neoechinorhynchus agilis]